MPKEKRIVEETIGKIESLTLALFALFFASLLWTR